MLDNNWFLKLLNFSQSARCVLFQYPSNTSRNVFKPTQLSPSLGYISKMIVVWWLVAGGPNGDGSCVRLLSPCHQCVCSWSHPFLANASVPVPILTLALAGWWWTVEVRGGRQRAGGGEDKLHTSHLPSPPPPTPQHCTLGTWDFSLSKIFFIFWWVQSPAVAVVSSRGEQWAAGSRLELESVNKCHQDNNILNCGGGARARRGREPGLCFLLAPVTQWPRSWLVRRPIIPS